MRNRAGRWSTCTRSPSPTACEPAASASGPAGRRPERGSEASERPTAHRSGEDVRGLRGDEGDVSCSSGLDRGVRKAMLDAIVQRRDVVEIVGTTKRKSFQSFVTFYLRAHRGAVKKSPKLLRVRFPNITCQQVR